MTYVGHYAKDRRQDWTTPRDLFDRLHAQHRFTMDGAATPDNALLPYYSTTARERPWSFQRVFCNPPWSNIAPFVELAPNAALAVLLVPARPNTRWFHRALALGAGVEFFLGRPGFGGTAKSRSPVDCLLLVWR